MMDPIIQYVPQGGSLIEVTVPSVVAAVPNPENEVDAAVGKERTMCVYVPSSGCPHPKQTQVLTVLRDGVNIESAQYLLDDFGIASLAEREHFIVVFPNPLSEGWNYSRDIERDDDVQFIVRCFAALKSTVGVSGFNGMMYHLACSPSASAVVWELAAERPLDAAAIMVGAFPEDYRPSERAGSEQVAWLYDHNDVAEIMLSKRNGADISISEHLDYTCHIQEKNPCVAYYVSDEGLSGGEIEKAWKCMFAGCRRWRNDDTGAYQPRPNFERLGFVPHVKDTCLDLSDGIGRTWFEYVPERLRATTDPIPLVLYFHGINCCGLYGAEQSGWAELANRDGFMCAFPDATAEMRWNAWGDDRIPTDIDYVMALIEHMAEVHPVDRSRIYISGFSMGSMFSNALAFAYPEVFAGVIALNGPHLTLENTLEDSVSGMLLFNPNSVIRNLEHRDEDKSPVRVLAESKRAERSWRMPFVQFVGLLDNVGFNRGKSFPIASADDGSWYETVQYWKEQNGISVEPMLSSETLTGIASDSVCLEGRFVHQSWSDSEGNEGLYHLIGVERMPHAVDLKSVEMGWEIIRRYRRNEDGSLDEVG